MYGQCRLRLKTTLQPSQRNTIWTCRSPIAWASRPQTGHEAVSSMYIAGIGSTLISRRLLFFDICLFCCLSSKPGGCSDVELRHVQVLQVFRGIHSSALQPLEQSEDVANACEIDVMLSGQGLDRL